MARRLMVSSSTVSGPKMLSSTVDRRRSNTVSTTPADESRHARGSVEASVSKEIAMTEGFADVDTPGCTSKRGLA